MAMSRSFGATPLTTLDPILITPALISSRPAIMRSKVDFPHPDGPTRMTKAPSGIWIETSCRTGVAPNDFFTFSIDKDAISHFPHARHIERARAIIRQQFKLSWGERVCDRR